MSFIVLHKEGRHELREFQLRSQENVMLDHTTFIFYQSCIQFTFPVRLNLHHFDSTPPEALQKMPHRRSHLIQNFTLTCQSFDATKKGRMKKISIVRDSEKSSINH